MNRLFTTVLSVSLLIPAFAWSSSSTVSYQALRLYQKVEALNRETASESRAKKIEKIVDEMFDLETFCREAMRDQRENLSEEQMTRFVSTFSSRFRRHLVDKLSRKRASLDRLQLGEEKTKPDGVELRFSVRKNGKTVKLKSKWVKTKTNWKLFDLSVSKADLVANYQGQFNKIIRDHGFEELMRRIEGGVIR